MTSPISSLAERTIGVIESVSPDAFKLRLTEDSPRSVALSTGSPTAFPRINGYLLVPNEIGAVVGIVTWMGEEEARNDWRPNASDPTRVSLPYARRRLALTPIGTLSAAPDDENAHGLKFERGVSAFPSIGDAVVLPNRKELQSIVERSGADSRLQIGAAPLAGGAKVTVDPNKLFGRHVAVLGNTGSGKSCSVAGLVRWSLDASRRLQKAEKSTKSTAGPDQPNARFIILDPNGEYTDAFSDLIDSDQARVLGLSSRSATSMSLVAPCWAWTAEEWTSILRTGPGFQAPVLRLALQSIKDWSESSKRAYQSRVVRFLSTWLLWVEWLVKEGPKKYAKFPESKEVSLIIKSAIDWLRTYHVEEEAPEGLGDIEDLIALMEAVRSNSINNGFQNAYDVNELESLRERIIDTLGDLHQSIPSAEGSPDRPSPFTVRDLEASIDMHSEHFGDSGNYARTMLLRLRRFAEDADIRAAVDSEAAEELVEILQRTFGAIVDGRGPASVIILDLSFVPRDVLHIVISVLGRIIFEALQWYRELHEERKVLPTAVVLEEAHTFVQRGGGPDSDPFSPSVMCRTTFERIAREGRKYGLGLVLSSQRPSEISPTVLSQCNTFLLHRLVNDKDQQLVSRLVPDTLAGFLKDLPSLPTRQAIILGWAVPAPTLVEMRYLEELQRPRSDDPDFWEVWTSEVDREVDWQKIADEWQRRGEQADAEDAGMAQP